MRKGGDGFLQQYRLLDEEIFVRLILRGFLAGFTACLLSLSAQAGEIGANKHGFSFNVDDWSIEDRGSEKKYAYGLATSPSGDHRFWFILSKVSNKETDREWQQRQLVKKILPRFAKGHGGKCESKPNGVSPISVDGVAGENNSVSLECRDGHTTEAAYVIFRSPDEEYRGFIWVYPNAGQREFDSSVTSAVVDGWRWK